MKKPVISKVENIGQYKKVLAHGPSGAGKTRFASTFPKPIIFDWEGGSMSIDNDLDVAIVAKEQLTISNFLEYLDWLSTPDAAQYETVVVDSLTHLQSIYLTETLPTVPDPRMAYGRFSQYLTQIMNKLFSLKKNVVVICRSKVGESIEGDELLFPELAPSAFTVVPALVDFAIVITGETKGIGNNKTVTQYGFAKHPKYWTKTRTLLADKFEPTYAGFSGASNDPKNTK